VSAAFSPDPATSFYRSRQLLIFLIVPLTMRVARGSRANATVHVIIAIGAISALIGIIQNYVLGWGASGLDHRPHGLLGHYMTYSGVLMLVVCAAVARLVYRGTEWVWPAVAVPALFVALFATLSRNAWLGTFVGIICLLSLRNWKLLVAVPIFIGLFAVAAPAGIRERAFSSFDLTNATNADRLSMLKSGVAMVEDHPIVGVGPNMVPSAYLDKYKRPDARDPEPDLTKLNGARDAKMRAHLHNVPMQLAAERGLPALLFWLAFVVIAARDLWRLAMRGPEPGMAAAGLAALVAMLVAGLFEHNFGDSEFLILFLGMMTLPFAAVYRSPAAAAAVPNAKSLRP